MTFWATGIKFSKKKKSVPELYIDGEAKTGPGKTDKVGIYF